MKSWPVAVTQALAADALVPRDFLWIEPRNRDTGARVGWGAWSDLGAVTVDVQDPVAGQVLRTFEGAGDLVQVSDIAMIAGLVVQTVDITLSGVGAQSEMLVRGYDARFAPMRLYRGWMDPNTMRLSAPAQTLFMGFVDAVEIDTPEAGGDAQIRLTCANHVQELTRSETATRSDADQRRRLSTDAFYQYTADVGEWQIKWIAS